MVLPKLPSKASGILLHNSISTFTISALQMNPGHGGLWSIQTSASLQGPFLPSFVLNAGSLVSIIPVPGPISMMLQMGGDVGSRSSSLPKHSFNSSCAQFLGQLQWVLKGSSDTRLNHSQLFSYYQHIWDLSAKCILIKVKLGGMLHFG